MSGAFKSINLFKRLFLFITLLYKSFRSEVANLPPSSGTKGLSSGGITGITVNIVNPGGAADTEGFEISEDRELAGQKVGGMVAPYKMVAPVCWLMSEQASQITGMRFDAIHWDENNSPEEEAKRIGRPLGFFLK